MLTVLYLPSTVVGWYLAAVLLLGFLFFYWLSRSKIAISLCSALLGLVLVLVQSELNLSQQYQSVGEKSLTVSVFDLPKYDTQKLRFIGIDEHSGAKLLLSLYADDDQVLPKLTAGDRLHLDAYLKPPHGVLNRFGFNREKYLFRHGIAAVGNIRQWQKLSQTNHGWRYQINRLRGELSDLIERQISNQKVQALLQALSVGDKNQLTADDLELFQNTGTAHLIAISGLHIAMLAAVGAWLGRLMFWLFPSRLNRPKWQMLGAFVFAACYALLAGLSIPTVRALLMLCCYLSLRWFGRIAYPWDVWRLSMVAVLLFDPLSVLDFGFWLSFGAVAVLIFSFYGRPNASKLWLFIKAQWVLLLGLLPLQLAAFSSIKIYTPLINLLVIPLVTLSIVPLLFLALVLAVLGLTPDFLWYLLQFFSELLLSMLHVFAQLPMLSIDCYISQTWQWWLLLLVVFVLLLPAIVPQRLWVCVLLPAVFWPISQRPEHNHFDATFFDVGQGLAVLIETQNHNLLYDVGAAYPSGFSWAAAVIVPHLRQRAINDLDLLILSHRDNDHSGGWSALSEQIEIQRTLGTEVSQEPCVVGEEWSWDGVYFQVLSPYNLQPYLKNNSSCVLKISSANGSLLLTGDIEQAVEYRLTNSKFDLTADILQMPHHGSNTSSTLDFIKAVNPQAVINSSGKYNRFNHPAQKVLNRYQQLHVPIHDTQNSGMIEFSTATHKIHSLNVEQPRIWRQ